LSSQTNWIPAWSNNYQPSRWEKQWLSDILGYPPVVDFGDGDWFAVDVQEDSVLVQIECQFVHDDGDIDLILYDASGYEVAEAISENDNENIEYQIDYGGIYYIQVYTNGNSNEYNLKWSIATDEPFIAVPSDYLTIQEAINAAANGDIIVVNDGIYTIPGPDGIDFNGKSITVRSQNGPENCMINAGGNGRGFYFHTGEQANSILSGFTITNGVIDGWSTGGGGILCDGASPTINNCIIRNNSVSAIAWGGGGISCVFSASPTIYNCVVEDNSSVDADGGGGIYCDNASPIIRNCTIVNNFAGTDSGGGLYVFGPSSTTVTNSIFWNNSPGQIDSSSTLSNITYSNIEGGFAGTGNINSNPLFAGAGIYALTAGSPCIDTGTTSGSPNSDITGTIRPQGNGYDIGAYEYQ